MFKDSSHNRFVSMEWVEPESSTTQTCTENTSDNNLEHRLSSISERRSNDDEPIATAICQDVRESTRETGSLSTVYESQRLSKSQTVEFNEDKNNSNPSMQQVTEMMSLERLTSAIPKEIIREAVQDVEFVEHYETTDAKMSAQQVTKQRAAAQFLSNAPQLETTEVDDLLNFSSPSNNNNTELEQGIGVPTRVRNMSTLPPVRRGSVLAPRRGSMLGARRGSVLAPRRGSLFDRIKKPEVEPEVNMTEEQRVAAWERVCVC